MNETQVDPKSPSPRIIVLILLLSIVLFPSIVTIYLTGYSSYIKTIAILWGSVCGSSVYGSGCEFFIWPDMTSYVGAFRLYGFTIGLEWILSIPRLFLVYLMVKHYKGQTSKSSVFHYGLFAELFFCIVTYVALGYIVLTSGLGMVIIDFPIPLPIPFSFLIALVLLRVRPPILAEVEEISVDGFEVMD